MAVSPDGSNIGLLQLNVIHLHRVGGDAARLLDAEINIAVAYEVWLDAGGSTRPWRGCGG